MSARTPPGELSWDEGTALSPGGSRGSVPLECAQRWMSPHPSH